MSVLSVNCNGCGASLDVSAETRFVTCGHCGARLEIKQSANSTYTEMLEKLDRKTEEIADELAAIRRQNEVERIDREWERERKQYLTADRSGNLSEPSAVLGVVAAVVAGVFGLFWMAGAASMSGGESFSLFGFVFISAAIYLGYVSVTKASAYEEAKRRYENRRAEAMDGKDEDEPAT
jgi:hypothetical protein